LTVPTFDSAGQLPACARASAHSGAAARLPTAPTGSERLMSLMSSMPSARLITMREIVLAPACSGSEPAKSTAGAKGFESWQLVDVTDGWLEWEAVLQPTRMTSPV